MNNVKIQETYELLPLSSERSFPAAPFPRTYVHCVIDDLRDAVLSVLELRTAGYPPSDIHVMAGWDYVEAVERRQQQHNLLSRRLIRFWSFLDEGLGDVYLHEAHRGRHILVVRLCRYEQREQVRSLLSPYHAYLMKYVDTWTVSDLTA